MIQRSILPIISSAYSVTNGYKVYPAWQIHVFKHRRNIVHLSAAGEALGKNICVERMVSMVIFGKGGLYITVVYSDQACHVPS
jgi:hypothetical protein